MSAKRSPRRNSGGGDTAGKRCHRHGSTQLSFADYLAAEAKDAVAEAEAIIRQPRDLTAYEIEDVLNELRDAFDNPPDTELLRLYRAHQMGRCTATLEEMRCRGGVRVRRNERGVRLWELIQ